MTEKVKCEDCGFLSARRLNSRELVEAEDIFRDSGKAPHAYGDYAIADVPVCFNGSFPYYSFLWAKKLATAPAILLQTYFSAYPTGIAAANTKSSCVPWRAL